MARAASAWLQALAPGQRAAARRPFAPEPRTDWHYVPRERAGVPISEMPDTAKALLWDLLDAVLSKRGRERVRNALLVESILGEMTANPGFRDPGKYALVLLGSPEGGEPWGWRFEGHHLSLNATVVPGGDVAVTPAFFGANPAEVPHSHGHHAGFRLLGEEEDNAFSLIRSLDDKLRQRTVISDRSLGDIVSGPGRETLIGRYEGVPLSALSEVQRDHVFTIAALYMSTMDAAIAETAMEKLRAAGPDGIHFAWAGALTPDAPHYFRIHASRALIEYDNTQNGANHVHSVWIDPVDLFGRDLLRAHTQTGHHGQR